MTKGERDPAGGGEEGDDVHEAVRDFHEAASAGDEDEGNREEDAYAVVQKEDGFHHPVLCEWDEAASYRYPCINTHT